VNSINSVFNNNTCESNTQNNYYGNNAFGTGNQLSSGKLETETDKINNKNKVNSDFASNLNNVQIKPSAEHNSFLRDVTAIRNHSSTHRAKNTNSFREFVIIHLFFDL